MKKYLMIFMMFCTLLSTPSFAVGKQMNNVELEFTLNYKPQVNQSVEHVMKNTVKLTDSKWLLAGKLVIPKTDDVLLFLVRQLSHKNNKYNLEFMIIDARNQKSFIIMPRVTTMIGLPVQLAEKSGEQAVQLNLLVNSK